MITSGTIAFGGATAMSRFVPAAHPAERDAVARALFLRLARWRAVQIVAIAVVATALALIAPDTFPPDLCALVALAIALDVGATVAFQADLGFGNPVPWSFRFPVQNLVL